MIPPLSPLYPLGFQNVRQPKKIFSSLEHLLHRSNDSSCTQRLASGLVVQFRPQSKICRFLSPAQSRHDAKNCCPEINSQAATDHGLPLPELAGPSPNCAPPRPKSLRSFSIPHPAS